MEVGAECKTVVGGRCGPKSTAKFVGPCLCVVKGGYFLQNTAWLEKVLRPSPSLGRKKFGFLKFTMGLVRGAGHTLHTICQNKKHIYKLCKKLRYWVPFQKRNGEKIRTSPFSAHIMDFSYINQSLRVQSCDYSHFRPL